MRSLKKRERTLLWLCLGTLFIAGNMLGANFVLKRIQTARKDVIELENQVKQYENAELRREEAERRMAYLDEHLPELEGAGKTKGLILEEIQNVIRDKRWQPGKQSLEEDRSTDHYQEVSVSVSFSGDLMEIMQWLVTLQKKDQFYVIKYLELELDKKSEEKEPQARCNLKLGRWFKPQST